MAVNLLTDHFADVVAGTTSASRALVVGENKELTELHLANGGLYLGSGAGTQMNATARELNNACDLSARLVTSDAALTVTVDDHAGKTIVMGGTGSAFTKTLPAAAGTGAIFRFVVGTVNTSNHVINANTNGGAFYGLIVGVDKDAAAVTGYHAAGTTSADIITLNGTTTGGLVGDWIEVQDIAANVWAVRGMVGVPAGSNPATPFS